MFFTFGLQVILSSSILTKIVQRSFQSGFNHGGSTSEQMKKSFLVIFPTFVDAFSFKRIVRRGKIKWWEKFNESNACSKVVQSWINSQIKSKVGSTSSQIDFLTEKSKIMAQLDQCSDPELFAVLAHKVASMAKAESSKGSITASEAGSDPDFNINEDDCLGVDVDFFED
ncbi:hypothetical protein Adt_10498 [Abeliophyllum distichum]|uniref:Uncharacterized protein n=1 Tax=Abeliophyllum distichum TaxID=126358 RepID=A0ABD1UK60_9LAMI